MWSLGPCPLVKGGNDLAHSLSELVILANLITLFLRRNVWDVADVWITGPSPSLEWGKINP